jgi:glycerophosphoryl diester phosphodiesterase
VTWRDFPFFEPCADGPVVVAHSRGAVEGDAAPLDAFRDAVALGLRFLEVDVCAPAGDVAVVRHDAGDDGRPLLRFEELLEELPDDIRYFVDLKDDAAGPAVARLAARTGCGGRLCLAAFSLERRRAAEAAFAEATGETPCTVLAQRQVVRLLLRSPAGRFAWRSPAPSANIPVRTATRRLIRTAHAGGALVFAWTVNDAPTMRLLLDRGVDGLITDEPALAVRVLAEGRGN